MTDTAHATRYALRLAPKGVTVEQLAKAARVSSCKEREVLESLVVVGTLKKQAGNYRKP